MVLLALLRRECVDEEAEEMEERGAGGALGGDDEGGC